MAVPDDNAHLRALTAETRVLMAITPDQPPSSCTCWAWTDHRNPGGWPDGSPLPRLRRCPLMHALSVVGMLT